MHELSVREQSSRDARLPLGPDDVVIRGEALADPTRFAQALHELGAAAMAAGWSVGVGSDFEVAADPGEAGAISLTFSVAR